MIKISVIMPVYNESILELKNSIDSIQHQTYPYFEFVIIDDNPKSQTIKKYLKYREHNDKRIKVFFNSENIGAMLSADRALNYSSGKFIARMDADDIATSDRLKKQLYFCIKNNLSLSCCNYICFKKKNYKSGKNKTIYPDITLVNQNKIKHIISYINIAIGPTLFFKRNVVCSVGGYRNILCEDYDLVARLLIYHYRIGYLSNPLIYKRERQNNISNYNGLKEFIICENISKDLRCSNFSKVLSIHYIKGLVNKLKERNKIKYYKYIIFSKRYKSNKSWINFIKRFYYAFSSILMLKMIITTHFSKFLQKILLK